MLMKKLARLPSDLPRVISERFSNCDIYDSSSSPEARVYFADIDGGYFIKVGESGTLSKEAMMAEYFHRLGIGTEFVLYNSGKADVLVTKKLTGCDLTSREYLDAPKKTAENMGICLRKLHALTAKDCPIKNRTADYLSTAEEGYKIGRFDPSYIDGRLNFHDAETAHEYILSRSHLLKAEALIHGDFCLPNIIFDGDKLSGYIDLGGAGIGDRHIDLFWGAWTLAYNLGTDEYREVFYNAYGRELVDDGLIEAIGAAECFA
jgi:kanamycin kinase